MHIPIPVILFLDASGCHTFKEEILEEEEDDDEWDRSQERGCHHFIPVDLGIFNHLANTDGNGLHVCSVGENQSKLEFVPAVDEGIDGGGSQAWDTEWEDDSAEGSPATKTINGSCSIQILWDCLKVGIHQPCTERYLEGDVDDDQTQMGVDEAIHLQDSEVRDEHDDRWEHLSQKDEAHEASLTLEVESGDTEASKSSNNQCEEGCTADNDEGVLEEDTEVIFLDDHLVTFQAQLLREHGWRVQESFRSRLEGSDDHPIDRDQDHQGTKNQEDHREDWFFSSVLCHTITP